MLLTSVLENGVTLSFDANGTITLTDSHKEKIDYLVVSTLAKNTFANWGSSSTEEGESKSTSFKHHVDHVLVPGSRSDPVLIRQRQVIIGNFLNFLLENNHPLFSTVLRDYHRIMSIFTNPHNGEIKFTIFPSFYRLLDKLREMNIRFNLVLRSFGNDLPEVVKEIEEHPSGLRFTEWGSFKERRYTVQGGESIERIDQIFERFLRPDTHFVVKDDWKTWNQDEERGRSGKPVPYSAKLIREKKHLPFAFDDNFTGNPERDIINPCEIAGEDIPREDLVNKLMFPVNTKEAILDPDYFINLVMPAITTIQEI